MVLSRSLLLAAFAVSCVQPAVAGMIEGRVDVRLEFAAPTRSPDVSALHMNTAPLVIPDRSISIVYLESAPRGAFEDTEPQNARMDQRGEAFVPYALPIRVGTTVEFPNADPYFHNVFSLSRARSFDLGRYASGESRSVVFETPGIVRLFCDIHSHMSAYILVFAHRYFDATDTSGDYLIEDVLPGSYMIVAWTDGRVRERRRIVVPEDDSPLRVDFVVE